MSLFRVFSVLFFFLLSVVFALLSFFLPVLFGSLVRVVVCLRSWLGSKKILTEI